MGLFDSKQRDGIAAKISLGTNEGYCSVRGELFQLDLDSQPIQNNRGPASRIS